MRRGDRILSVNGKSLENVTTKTALSHLKEAGNTVTIELVRRAALSSSIPSNIGSKIPSRKVNLAISYAHVILHHFIRVPQKPHPQAHPPLSLGGEDMEHCEEKGPVL